MTGQRAQVFTLEGVLAALVVVAGLVFALQAVVVTPNTGTASNNAVGEAQLNDVLASSAESGGLNMSDLKLSVLYWNATLPEEDNDDDDESFGTGFYNSSRNQTHYNGADFNRMHGLLAPALDSAFDETVSMNVFVHYRNKSGQINGSFPMILNGAPGNNAVRSSTTIPIYDSDEFVANARTRARTGTTVKEANMSSSLAFYAPDAYPDNDLYNVFEVEVIVWQQ